MLKVLYMAVLFCERSLSIAIGLLHILKSVFKFIDLHMQITDLPKTLSPEQVIDVLVTASTPFGMVDGDKIGRASCRERVCMLV